MTIVGIPQPSASTTSPFSPTPPQTARIGNKLIIGGSLRGTATTSITVPTGWSGSLLNGDIPNSSNHGGTFILWRDADGTALDTPSITWVGGSIQFIFSEQSGLGALQADGASAGTSITVNTSTITGQVVCTAPAYVYTVWGGLTNGASPVTSMAGGAVIEQAFVRGSTAVAAAMSGSQIVTAGGTINPTGFISSGGTCALRIQSVAFNLASDPGFSPPARRNSRGLILR